MTMPNAAGSASPSATDAFSTAARATDPVASQAISGIGSITSTMPPPSPDNYTDPGLGTHAGHGIAHAMNIGSRAGMAHVVRGHDTLNHVPDRLRHTSEIIKDYRATVIRGSDDSLRISGGVRGLATRAGRDYSDEAARIMTRDAATKAAKATAAADDVKDAGRLAKMLDKVRKTGHFGKIGTKSAATKASTTKVGTWAAAKAGIRVGSKFAAAIPVAGWAVAIGIEVGFWVFDKSTRVSFNRGMSWLLGRPIPNIDDPPQPPRTHFLPLFKKNADNNRFIETRDAAFVQTNNSAFDFPPERCWHPFSPEIETTSDFAAFFDAANTASSVFSDLVDETLALFNAFAEEQFINELAERRTPLLQGIATFPVDQLAPVILATQDPLVTIADAYMAFRDALFDTRLAIFESASGLNPFAEINGDLNDNDFKNMSDPGEALRDVGVRLTEAHERLKKAGNWTPPSAVSASAMYSVKELTEQAVSHTAEQQAQRELAEKQAQAEQDQADRTATPPLGGVGGGSFSAPAFTAPAMSPGMLGGSFGGGAGSLGGVSTPTGGGFTAPSGGLKGSESLDGLRSDKLKTPSLDEDLGGKITTPDGLDEFSLSTPGLNLPEDPSLGDKDGKGLTLGPDPLGSDKIGTDTSGALPGVPPSLGGLKTDPSNPSSPLNSGNLRDSLRDPSLAGTPGGVGTTTPTLKTPPSSTGTTPSTPGGRAGDRNRDEEKDKPTLKTEDLPDNEDVTLAPPPTIGSGIAGNFQPQQPPAANLASPNLGSGIAGSFGGGGAPGAPDLAASLGGGGGEDAVNPDDPAAAMDPNDPAANPEALGGEEGDAPVTTEVHRNGETFDMGSPKAASMAEMLNPQDGSEPLSLREAASKAGFLVPETGDIGTPISPADLRPGDVVIGDGGREGIYIGDGMCLTKDGVVPLTDVATFNGPGQGIFRLEDARTAGAGGDAPNPDGPATFGQGSDTSGTASNAVGESQRLGAMPMGGMPMGGLGGGAGLPRGGPGGKVTAVESGTDPFDPQNTLSGDTKKMTVTGTDGVGVSSPIVPTGD